MSKDSFLSKPIIYVTFLFAIGAVVMSIFSLMQNNEIVYVDSIRLFANYKGSLKAKTAYEQKMAQWKANVDTLTNELNGSFAKYEKEKARMSAKEKKVTEELLMTKRQQLENYRAAVSENASKEDQTITGQVTIEINDFLHQYGEAHGYDFILGATNAGNVVFAKKGKNITDEVLKQLNNEYRGAK
jgi:outer membrane protein